MSNISAGLNLYNVLHDPNAGPIMKTFAIVQQVAALVPILAPSLVTKLNQLLQVYCFPEGTEVATAEGEKPIEKIRVGDLVWSQNGQTGEIMLKRVKQVFANVAAALVVLHCGRNTLEATPEHPLWVAEQGWKAAGQIQAGDELWTRSGERFAVTAIAHKQGQFPVYNFEVEDFHSYFVGKDQLLVHSKCVFEVISNFRSRFFNFGANVFLLDKKGMEHFLTRHHPDYWDGSVKSVQTFFDPRMSADELAGIAHEVMKQNRIRLATPNATSEIFQITGTVNGKQYVVGLNNGRVGQLYPK
jgi:hypothetical protein